jgi:hypothetical protein
MNTHRDTQNMQASRLAQAERFRQSEENEAQAWSEHSQQAPIQESKTRYRAQSAMLDKAISGDIQMASSVLQYMSSTNQDLRHMMQSAVHDHQNPVIWRYLLNFLALHTWEDAYWQIGLADAPGERSQIELQCAEVGKSLSTQSVVDCLQSVVEAFILDESAAESAIKGEIFHDVLAHSGEIAPHLPPNQEQRRRLVRYAAAYLSGLRANPDVILILEEMIENAALTWKVRAVQALGVIQDSRCCPALLKALTMGLHPLHQEASRTLNAMGALARGCWEDALQHPNSHVRWHAARGLGQIGDTKAIEVLAEGLFDDNQAVRWVTASVLASLNSTAIPAILNVLTRNRLSEPFRQAVHHALHAMPSRLTQEYLQPLLLALRSPAANVEAPRQAQRMLLDWKVSQPGKAERSSK